jgi:serine/threonine protein kinase
MARRLRGRAARPRPFDWRRRLQARSRKASQGILHRDLKPGNILITTAGDPPRSTAKLLDFGLATLVASDDDVTRTVDGAIVGTVSYISPEQAEGRLLDVRSDVFSFGAHFQSFRETARGKQILRRMNLAE